MSHFCRRVTALTLLLLLTVSLSFPLLVHADDGNRTIVFKLSYSSSYGDLCYSNNKVFKVVGKGHFAVCSYRYRQVASNGGVGKHAMAFRLFSDEVFTCQGSDSGRAGTFSDIGVSCYNGIYYVTYGFLGGISENLNGHDVVETWSGYPNLEVVSSYEDIPSGEEIIDSGILDLTKDSYRDPDPDTDGTLSNSIPTPKIHVNKDYSFGFDNCTDDYYIQMQGRFWSVDDIELYKENMMWKYRYNSYIKGDLNDWYTAGSKTKAGLGNLSFLENGQACFDEFLQQHPVGERNFYGGTNAVGNFFSGYNSAIDTIKMLLGQPASGYNGVEVYVRYFTYTDTGELIYGKWCHYYDDLAKSGSSGSDWDDDNTLHNGQQSENGLTDNEKTENEKKDDSRKGDHDVSISTPDDDYTGNGVTFTGVIELLDSLKSQSSAFLSLFSEMFSFLPAWLVSLIYASMGVCCFLGIWHFVRG